ncbi:hypothetical protein LDENG_00086000 [Lucifuga dentata]|nr:hypothetical protein LDENG_00086000 [Lucifuga dentata]
MQAARKTQVLSYNSSPIFIFEDFSAAIVKKRQEFYSVKQQLKKRAISFAILYPAVLKISYEGRNKYFKQPTDIAEFLGNLPMSPDHSPPEEPVSPTERQIPAVSGHEDDLGIY